MPGCCDRPEQHAPVRVLAFLRTCARREGALPFVRGRIARNEQFRALARPVRMGDAAACGVIPAPPGLGTKSCTSARHTARRGDQPRQGDTPGLAGPGRQVGAQRSARELSRPAPQGNRPERSEAHALSSSLIASWLSRAVRRTAISTHRLAYQAQGCGQGYEVNPRY